MALIKTDFYNQLTKEQLPALPPKGTVVMYELMVNNEEVKRDALHSDRVQPLPSSVWIPCTSTTCIINEEGDEVFVPIALIKNVSAHGDLDFYRREIRPNSDGVYLTIQIGSSAANNDLYQYLELASFVIIDGKKVPDNCNKLFKKVESEKEATRKRDARLQRKAAMDAAEKLDSIGLQKAALLLGFYASSTDESIIRDKVEEFAESNPTQFFDRVVNDTHGNAKATVLHGLHLGVLKVQDNAVVWADSKAAICTLSSNIDPEIQVANWANESPENLKTFGFIEDAIGKKISKNASTKKK